MLYVLRIFLAKSLAKMNWVKNGQIIQNGNLDDLVTLCCNLLCGPTLSLSLCIFWDGPFHLLWTERYTTINNPFISLSPCQIFRWSFTHALNRKISYHQLFFHRFVGWGWECSQQVSIDSLKVSFWPILMSQMWKSNSFILF